MPKKTHNKCHLMGVQMTSQSPTEGTCPLQVPQVRAVIVFSFSSVLQGISGHWFGLNALWVILICPQGLEPLIWLVIGKNTFWQDEREKFPNIFLKTFNEHFTDEEPETQRHEATCSSLNNEQAIGPGLEPVIISFTKYQVLSMTSGRMQNRRQELCQILGRRGERGLEAEGASRRISEKRQNGRDIADWSPASVSKVCVEDSLGHGSKMVGFPLFSFYLLNFGCFIKHRIH